MFYWIIYDIGQNRIRTKIASKCKNYGLLRVQKSSFLGNISKNKMDMLAIEIKDLIKESEDCVYIFPSCKPCFESKIIVGKLDEEKLNKKDFCFFGG